MKASHPDTVTPGRVKEGSDGVLRFEELQWMRSEVFVHHVDSSSLTVPVRNNSEDLMISKKFYDINNLVTGNYNYCTFKMDPEKIKTVLKDLEKVTPQEAFYTYDGHITSESLNKIKNYLYPKRVALIQSGEICGFEMLKKFKFLLGEKEEVNVVKITLGFGVREEGLPGQREPWNEILDWDPDYIHTPVRQYKTRLEQDALKEFATLKMLHNKDADRIIFKIDGIIATKEAVESKLKGKEGLIELRYENLGIPPASRGGGSSSITFRGYSSLLPPRRKKRLRHSKRSPKSRRSKRSPKLYRSSRKNWCK